MFSSLKLKFGKISENNFRNRATRQRISEYCAQKYGPFASGRFRLSAGRSTGLICLLLLLLCCSQQSAFAQRTSSAPIGGSITKTTVSGERKIVDQPIDVNRNSGGLLVEETVALPIDYNPITGVLYLTGDGGVNNARVTVNSLNEVVARINWGSQLYVQRFARSAVTEIYFYGYGDNDSFLNGTDIRSIADGGSGNDRLTGGKGADHLYGNVGNDNIYAGAGDDYVYGGSGNDTIHGAEGSDILFGNGGDDTISDYAFSATDINFIDGGGGNDLIYGYGDASLVEISGGDGADTICAFGHAFVYGNGGDDLIYGTAGNDLLNGGDGNDWIYGGPGHDTLLGQDGEDFLYGEAGNDFVYGGNDDDLVDGGAGNDGVFGGDGSDWLFGRSGDDVLSGGYAYYDMTSGYSSVNDISDWNYDYLYGGTGIDRIWVGDKKFPWFWLDTAMDATAEDNVAEAGWNLLGGFHIDGGGDWGHLSGF